MQYFGEPEGRVKIQMILHTKRYYTLKCLIRDLDLPRFLIFRAVGGMRRVQISCDICTRFAPYLYSTKQCWIIITDIYGIILTLFRDFSNYYNWPINRAWPLIFIA